MNTGGLEYTFVIISSAKDWEVGKACQVWQRAFLSLGACPWLCKHGREHAKAVDGHSGLQTVENLMGNPSPSSNTKFNPMSNKRVVVLSAPLGHGTPGQQDCHWPFLWEFLSLFQFKLCLA
jgi:hypothetical protein